MQQAVREGAQETIGNRFRVIRFADAAFLECTMKCILSGLEYIPLLPDNSSMVIEKRW